MSDNDLSQRIRSERRRRRKEMARRKKNGKSKEEKLYDPSSKFSKSEINEASDMAKKYIQEKDQDINDTYSRCFKMVEETTQLGADTLENLNDQSNQMQKIHQDVFDCNEMLDEADDSLNVISSWSGWIKSKFKKPRRRNHYEGMKSAHKDDNRVPKPNKQQQKKQKQMNNKLDKDLKNYDNLTDRQKRKVNYQQKDQLLMEYLDGLQLMANEMGTELDRQNDMIEELQDVTGKLNTKVTTKNRKINKILRS